MKESRPEFIIIVRDGMVVNVSSLTEKSYNYLLVDEDDLRAVNEDPLPFNIGKEIQSKLDEDTNYFLKETDSVGVTIQSLYNL